jgi:hypothetical protein
VGGRRYLGNIDALRRTYLLEQKYWRKFLSLPLDDFEKKFPQKSTLDDSENANPALGKCEEEEENLKVSSSDDFHSYPALWEEKDLEEKGSLEEEDDGLQERKETTQDNVVSRCKMSREFSPI